MHVYQCPVCGKWCEGAAYHLLDSRTFDVHRGWYYASPDFCSEECRDQWKEEE